VPQPHESATTHEPQQAAKLTDLQYITVTDKLTGVKRIVEGPTLFFPGTAYEDSAGPPTPKIVLEKNEYVRLRDAKSGQLRQVQGPATVVPQPHESATTNEPQRAAKLTNLQYVTVTDRLSGVKRIVEGPTLFFPGTAYEDISQPGRAFQLKRHQYVRLLDQSTGVMRVERGEAIVFPRAHEQPADGDEAVRDAVSVDDETAVLVRSLQTGQQRLVTEQGLFIPHALEEIVEVRKLVRVDSHEVAIVRDNKGKYTFHTGKNGTSEGGTAFHIPPFSELVTMYWSSGTSAEDTKNHVVRNAKQVAYKVPVQKIDLRPQYAFFEYKVRTSDNVELVLEGTIFWSVEDVPRMIERTSDPKGDVWYHARSSLIQAVSTVTLEQFMASFNAIVARAAATDADFYAQRGVRLYSLEVTRYECADGKTATVLQEIIQETTNRINRMMKQKSDNEVEHEELTAKIALERQRTALIEAKTANEKLQASVEGEAEGTRLAQNTLAFLNQLNGSVPADDERLALLRFFSEQATLTKQTEHLASGTASLFLTPQDVNLKLAVPSPTGAGA